MSDPLSTWSTEFSSSGGKPDTLIEHLTQDMAARWARGERPAAEEYLAQHPELHEPPDAALELLYEEISLRQQYGVERPAEEFVRRFPQWERQLQLLWQCHHLLDPDQGAPRFPAAGETLGDFRLLEELGRGAHGRVFLATQPSLGERPVVLKLAVRSGGEHLSLARLQHSHIVPLYAVYDFSARGLRALCLPYFGGLTHERLLGQLRSCPPARRTGQQVLAAIQEAQSASPVGSPAGGPAWTYLKRATYAETICWLGVCLADALHYAQARGLVHLDLKPSNVLWAGDGQPMLLDFHLAHAPLAAGQPAPLWLGGTPGYMAPEQEAALGAVRAGRPVAADVDGRADVYALGLLLYEALAGGPPQSGNPATELRRRNPRIASGLADLLARCLAREPAERYAGADLLAADLRRHLADLPLRGVRNRSWGERWRKWRRRRPSSLPLGLVALLLLGGVAGYAAYVDQQAHQASQALADGRDHLRRQEYAAAWRAFHNGHDLVDGLPFQDDLARQLHDHERLAARAQAAQRLHVLIERLRPLYGAGDLPVAEARALAEDCGRLWRERERIGARLLAMQEVQPEQQIQTDLLDLAILWSDLRLRLAPPAEVRSTREQVLEVLAEAEKLYGPNCILCREVQAQAEALGRTEEAAAAARRGASLPPRSAWEHYALGRAAFRAGDLPHALVDLERSLEILPQALWPNYYKGCCAFQLGRYEDAVVAFTACAALAPDSPWCVYNRGRAYAELGRADHALRDYNRALLLDPHSAVTALARGVLHYRHQQHDQAIGDLLLALDLGADRATALYNLALVHVARKDRAAALDCLEQALAHDPPNPEASKLREQLLREP